MRSDPTPKTGPDTTSTSRGWEAAVGALRLAESEVSQRHIMKEVAGVGQARGQVTAEGGAACRSTPVPSC